MGMFRKLPSEEIERWRRQTRETMSPYDSPVNPFWHPVVRLELAQMLMERALYDAMHNMSESTSDGETQDD